MIKEAISRVVERQNLSAEEAETVMNEIMGGKCTPAQVAAYVTALRMKGETIDEITGSARVMRAKATPIPSRHRVLVDTAGTGGDGSRTFNISTTAALVAAGAGVPVAKHGGRGVSSGFGSADLMAALGIDIEASPEQVSACLDEVGISFLFAPLLHGAMKYAAGPRREMGIRTVFNIMGPITNPAGAHCQVIGVYGGALTETLARVLANLGSRRAFVVHGSDGLDEVTLSGPTRVSELREGEVRTYDLMPEDFGLKRGSIEACRVTSQEDNVQMTLMVLNGRTGPPRDIVLMNAAVAIYVGEGEESLLKALLAAKNSIDSGGALRKLQAIREFSKRSVSSRE